jgi:hypothetical protein
MSVPLNALRSDLARGNALDARAVFAVSDGEPEHVALPSRRAVQ